MHLSCALKWSGERSDCTFSHWHIQCSIEFEKAERILGAVMYVSIPANARHGEQAQLWCYNSTRDRKCVIKSRIAIDDDWERMRRSANGGCARRDLRVMKGWPANLRRYAQRTPLPLIVRSPRRCRRTDASDQTCNNDERHNVWN